jgi:hypothetical protein
VSSGVRARVVEDVCRSLRFGMARSVFRTRVSCCGMARVPGICPPRRAWCGRATTGKDSISSSTSPPGWESCRFRVACGRVRASRGGSLLEAVDLAVA